MKYNKLVRDKIPKIIKKNGEIPLTHVASDEEYSRKLFEKLQEEVDEFLEEKTIEELADILEVIHSICDLNNVDKEELEFVRRKKAEERGTFKERIILDETKSSEINSK